MRIRNNGQQAYTFLELMLTVSILSMGIVGIYKVLLSSLDYQTQLSNRLFANNLIEHQIALLENKFAIKDEFPAEENGKVVEAILDYRKVPFDFSMAPASVQDSLTGLLPISIVLSWPDNGKIIRLKRDLYLVNLKAIPGADSLRQSPTLK